MRYLGNKTRISKYLKPILEKHLDGKNPYIEPFVGAAGMISNIDYSHRMGFDSDKYIIELLRRLKIGWIPPTFINDTQYRIIKNNPDIVSPHLVGFVGYGCSFGGKWFAGLAKGGTNSDGSPRNHVTESSNNLIKLRPKIQNCSFDVADYRQLEVLDSVIAFGQKAVIYCDPPYGYGSNVTKYKSNFDSDEFFQWVRFQSSQHYVYVSEYNAPDDFKCIWQKESKTGIHHGFETHPTRTEKLFVFKGGLSDEYTH